MCSMTRLMCLAAMDVLSWRESKALYYSIASAPPFSCMFFLRKETECGRSSPQ
jgi:hypothetical protein